MLTKKSIGIALAAALALGASGAAFATPTNVGGVVFDPSSPLYLTINADNFRETSVSPSVSNPHPVLHGYGVVSTLDGNSQSTFCPGCDLNFTFSYTLASVVPDGSGFKAIFNLGSINFFVDNTSSYNVLNPMTAGIGTPWLTLSGHTSVNSSFVGPGELFSTINGTTAKPTSGSTGIGLLDATSGPASSHFKFQNISDGLGGFADLQFNSSFLTKVVKGCGSTPTTDLDNVCTYPITGVAVSIGSPTSVPEPGEVGLLGLGLGALGLLLRRRRKEAEKK